MKAAFQTKDIYSRRFKSDVAFRNELWEILCKRYFQKFISPQSTVLEIAAGYCEFINNIGAAHKIAVDINEQTAAFANPDVRVIATRSSNLSALENECIDNIFISNFFEHIERDEISRTLIECRRVLKPNGQILILQPNIRYVYKDYWMFYDHITPIDDRALCECLELLHYRIHTVVPRFLPYTTKSKLPRAPWLIKLYLKMPFLFHIFGGQAFIIALK
jgi:ubiquinone/menaquinone biosynthesis C-methylase UbiE